MTTNIELNCPRCFSNRIVRNGKKADGKQNYKCNACNRQFISEHERTYMGSVTWIDFIVKRMLVRGIGIRDISFILMLSMRKILDIIISSDYEIVPMKSYYDTLEIDELWTFVGNKKNQVWLIYAYHRESGEIVAYVWGKRDLETANALKKRLEELGVRYGRIACDQWNSFLSAFGSEAELVGKRHTVGIEGNNCRLRHRARRLFRKTCCFSKDISYHKKALDMVFYYINYGFV